MFSHVSVHPSIHQSVCPHPHPDWLHGGRYVSCVHAGGLSCYLFFTFSDIQKLSYSALVLTMIFSMGETIPVQHYGMSHAFYIFKKN